MTGKVKHKKKSIEKKEFLFNITSLVVVITVGLYFGVRSFYYYGKQNMRMMAEDMTLNGTIINSNKIVKDGDGLHQDTDGYYFKGNVSNNYVKFANRIFRVISINNKNEVKVVSDDLVSSFIWGNKNSYKNSNLMLWLDKSGSVNSGIYYNTIPSPKDFLVKTSYSEDKLLDDKVSTSSDKMNSYVTTLGVKDYTKANGKNSYLNIKKYFWLLGLDKDNSNLYVNSSGSVEVGTNYDAYGVRAVITFKKNLRISTGDGTLNNPYVIEQGSRTNYVDQYVRLGNDLFKVFSDQDGILKMAFNGDVSSVGTLSLRDYSKKGSLYDSSSSTNIGYYLNGEYLSSLSYAPLLNDCKFYIGEISNETGLGYGNIFTQVVDAKIGLLNMFDYNTNTLLDNYFLMNTTSSVGNMVYVYHANGLVEEVLATDDKYIVPVISINKNVIKKGVGSIEDPFSVE